jgi:hypothetical protein
MHRRYWKAILLALVAAGAALAFWHDERAPAPERSLASPTPPGPSASLAVPSRPELGRYRATAPEPAPKPAPIAPAPVAEPAMPPVPYRFAGTLGQQVLLAKDTTIVAVAPGEVLDGLYRIDAIDDKSITLTYLPLGRKVMIELKP